MASKGGKDPKKGPAEEEGPVSKQAYSQVVRDDTPFPVPDIYFKVYDSELDEPEAKIRRDVGKLYERWQKKYGRRWPENGMNTEDLVWLAEEAYKPEIPLDERGTRKVQLPSGPPSAKALGKVPVEKENFPGEFLTEPGDDGAPSAASSSGAAPKGPAAAAAKAKKKAAMSNYEATAAGGNWVTDEFESVDYEAGNLETLWGMHLFDYEGKPTMMPDGPPDEAQVRFGAQWDPAGRPGTLCAHAAQGSGSAMGG